MHHISWRILDKLKWLNYNNLRMILILILRCLSWRKIENWFWKLSNHPINIWQQMKYIWSKKSTALYSCGYCLQKFSAHGEGRRNQANCYCECTRQIWQIYLFAWASCMSEMWSVIRHFPSWFTRLLGKTNGNSNFRLWLKFKIYL